MLRTFVSATEKDDSNEAELKLNKTMLPVKDIIASLDDVDSPGDLILAQLETVRLRKNFDQKPCLF